MRTSKFVCYLHGFASAPNSTGKARQLAERLGMEIFQPYLQYQIPGWFEKLKAELKMHEQKGKKCVALIGNSMGGFVAETLHRETNLPTLLTNPAWNPSESVLKYLGMNQNHVTGEWFEIKAEDVGYLAQVQQHRDSLVEFDRKNLMAVFGRQDAVVPPILSRDFYASVGYEKLILIDGDHRLADEFEQVLALPEFEQLFGNLHIS